MPYDNTTDSDSAADAPERQPYNPEFEDDDDVASLDDHSLHRDSDGNLIPQKVYVREFDNKVVSRPMERDERRRYIQPLAEGEKDELTDAELAELFDKKIVKPDLGQHPLCDNGRVTKKFVKKGLTQSQEDGYFIAILLASGDDEMVRRVRGEFTDEEIKLIKAQMESEGGNLASTMDRNRQ